MVHLTDYPTVKNGNYATTGVVNQIFGEFVYKDDRGKTNAIMSIAPLLQVTTTNEVEDIPVGAVISNYATWADPNYPGDYFSMTCNVEYEANKNVVTPKSTVGNKIDIATRPGLSLADALTYEGEIQDSDNDWWDW